MQIFVGVTSGADLSCHVVGQWIYQVILSKTMHNKWKWLVWSFFHVDIPWSLLYLLHCQAGLNHFVMWSLLYLSQLAMTRLIEGNRAIKIKNATKLNGWRKAKEKQGVRNYNFDEFVFIFLPQVAILEKFVGVFGLQTLHGGLRQDNIPLCSSSYSCTK